MSKVAIAGNASGTGVFTIASPNSNTDRTLDIPDASGTIDRLNRAGNVLQVVQNTSTTTLNLNSTALTDLPATISITPSSTSSKILVMYNCGGVARGLLDSMGLRLLRNSTVIVARSRYSYQGAPDGNSNIHPAPIFLSHLDSPNTTSSITYKVQAQIGNTDGTAGWQINTTGSELGDIAAESLAVIIAMEIAG